MKKIFCFVLLFFILLISSFNLFSQSRPYDEKRDVRFYGRAFFKSFAMYDLEATFNSNILCWGGAGFLNNFNSTYLGLELTNNNGFVGSQVQYNNPLTLKCGIISDGIDSVAGIMSYHRDTHQKHYIRAKANDLKIGYNNSDNTYNIVRVSDVGMQYYIHDLIVSSIDESGTTNIKAGISLPIKLFTKNYTVKVKDYLLIDSTGTTNDTLFLHTAIGYSGKTYKIKKRNAGAGWLILKPTGSEMINDSSVIHIPRLTYSYSVTSDGSNWYIH